MLVAQKTLFALICPKGSVFKRFNRPFSLHSFTQVNPIGNDTRYPLLLLHVVLPVFVLPDAEPLDQVLGALELRVKTVLLTFEP